MTARALRCALVALAALAAPRAGGAMGFGNPAPAVSPPVVSPLTAGVAPAGAVLLLECAATDTGGAVGTLTVRVFAGSDLAAPPIFTSDNLVTAAASSVRGSTSWPSPPAPASYTAACEATDTGFPAGKSSSSLTFSTEDAALPPIVSPISGPGEVLVGSASAFLVTASDPSTPAQPLTYAWTASGGTITPDAANPAAASWSAPATPGPYEIVAAVSNGAGTVQSKKTVQVVLATYQARLPVPLAAPRRIAAGESGALFAVDGQQAVVGKVALVTARGEVRGFATLPEPALAVASGAGLLWITTTKGNLFKVDPATGRTVGKVALAGGPFVKPLGIAYDPANMRLWVADTDANRVRVIAPDGATAAVIESVGGAPLAGPVDVAIDGASARAWVLAANAKKESALLAGEPVAAARFLHAFGLGGEYVASYVAQGGEPGQLTRAAGIAVGPHGRLYLSDVFQGTVQVLGPGAAPLGTIGSFGSGEGQLLNPMGLAVMGNGDLAVANTSIGKIERFGAGVGLPVCAGDADCDGLPDAWEIANGLDPSWAGDALLDLDGDRLSNVEEYALGTNPRSADTDGDGYRDGDELLAGFDPLNPNDHAPVVSASGPAEVGPGLVRLSAVASGRGTCEVRWTQAGGPPVSLRSANTAAPTFIARAAGAYDFDAIAVCGAASSAPGRVRVAVRNVPPRADAGGVMVATPGAPLRLDALDSSDANGDALAFTWEQTLGPAVSSTATGGVLGARARGPRLYAFQVTVSDPAGAAATAEVPVMVATGPAPTAIGAALPGEATVGEAVVLDASASVAPGGADFSWHQVAGPAVHVAGADHGVASFVPPAAGRYAFDVSVADRLQRSPPARVEVFVAEAGKALPTVTASAPTVTAVNAPVSLEATAGGEAVEYAWRQISGPAAGLSEADRATATAVAFVPGFYVFEVSVRHGAAESRPARVAFEARSGGRPIPRARIAAAPGDAWAGQLVLLDGGGSTGAARYRWTQVGGPWVALGTQASVTWFRPLVPGVYAFELVVDDGAARSAPARVEINVVRHEGVQ